MTGIQNLFDNESSTFSYSELHFTHYGSIIKKLKAKVEATFGIRELYFTAPTFITRLDGQKDWNPTGWTIYYSFF